MPRPRKDQAQDTREVALSAARRLLHELGYQGVSMDAVAGASGVRKATLYYHFPQGKAELVLEIADRAIAHDARGIARAAAAHASARARLTAIAGFLGKESIQTGQVLRDALRFMDQAHQEQVAARFRSQLFAQVLTVFTDGVTSGELRPHDAERSGWAFLGLIAELGEVDPSPQAEPLAPWIVDLMLDGLKP